MPVGSSNPLLFRLDCMGDFGDDDQRPAKRLRLDQAGAGQGAPPPDGHGDGFPQGWGTSQPFPTEWVFTNRIMPTGSLPMPMPASVVGIMPNPNAAMAMISPMDNSMGPAEWDQMFDVAPNSDDISAPFPPHSQHVVFAAEEGQQPLQPPSAPYPSLQSQPALQSQPRLQLQPPARPRQTQPSRSPSLISEPVHQGQRRRKFRSKHAITSPFSDCLDSFGRKFTLQTFSRPVDGKVNGYIKFSWPQKGGRRSSRAVGAVNTDHDASLAVTFASKHSGELVLQCLSSASPSTSTTTLQPGSDSPFSTSSTLAVSQSGGSFSSPMGSVWSYGQGDAIGNPQFSPSQFGEPIVMDTMGRKLFDFYIRNWCPGRTVLKHTNLWLSDFGSAQSSTGVLAAIQSLAGIYIHDYLPDDSVRRLVNKKFTIAEARLSELLQDVDNLDLEASSELVTLASLLSMQDIVLTERRLKKPFHPRWLTGFKQAESILQRTDPGNRFYKESNVQVSALRLSQSVIVGRAVILAQPMMPLPALATFDPIAETSRFGFLLYGSKADMFEIHGGCGFSKRVLYVFNQVSYCSTRLLQDGETPIVPVAADLLYDQLLNLHQWSSEYETWEDAQSKRQPIEWIRKTDESYIVQEAEVMTEVTAEAWRLAAMVYLQCRLFRLPRNHPEVVANLADLAKSISIMPTSGPVFTAQAPLLPVFFLGLLATVEEHVQVADAWFQQVMHTPVRSSVPPLFKTLERIQAWMNQEIPMPAPNVQLPRVIAERQPWWERMVSKVQEKETEVLCLT